MISVVYFFSFPDTTDIFGNPTQAKISRERGRR